MKLSLLKICLYKKQLLIVSILFMLTNPVSAYKEGTFPFEDIHIQQTLPSHLLWNSLLQKYVDAEGHVDFRGLKKEISVLDNYLHLLSENPPTENWSKQDVLAYFINLYNAATVKLIVENYPVESIRDIKQPWTAKRVEMGGRKISLDDIEHNMLRKMDEPRIHFALNCASISCPKLNNVAYEAATLDKQLDKAAIQFINSSYNYITPAKAEISPIFKWYFKDFKVNGKVDVIGYVNQYSKVKMNPDAKVKFKRYNWNLNSQENLNE